MGRVSGKVAFITGAARGQGRAHALRLAEEGADIIAVDVCQDIPGLTYGMGTSEELAETRSLVEALNQRIITSEVDVRDSAALTDAVKHGVSELGRLDIVSANAGIVSSGKSWEIPESTWQQMLDINLTGVWKTVKACIPAMLEAGNGGSVVLTSSEAGVRGMPNISHYVSAKHGVVGLMKSLANELGPDQIRVNAILPGNVATEMIFNDTVYKLYRPDLEHPGKEDISAQKSAANPMGLAWMEPRDISNALLWLASDESRFVTGLSLVVDAGWHVK